MWIISRVFGESRWTRAIFCLIVLQAIFAIAFEVVIFVFHNNEINLINHLNLSDKESDELYIAFANARSLLVYFVLFMIAQLFTVGLVVDAIYQRNTIQLIALVAFELGMTAYSFIQFHQSSTLFSEDGSGLSHYLGDAYHNSKWAQITQACTMCISTCIFCFLAYKLYLEFGWHIYKKIGADLAMRALLIVAWWPASKNSGSTSSIVKELIEHIILSCVISILALISAYWGLRRERKPQMYMFFFSCLTSMAYYIYTLVQIAQNPSKFLGSKAFLTFFLCVNLVLILVSVPIGVICLRNFNLGLMNHISHATASATSAHSMAPLGLEKANSTRRWSIE
ncbi:hypothetical protein G6F37_007947 [Rhizopus arrhizus]|nr:hypothetical protein G6F38_002218 [Rhizopus arrhizus]KAG1156064.1 hypothetical protein G6F37_007947 [Rhizopus arrhizus]